LNFRLAAVTDKINRRVPVFNDIASFVNPVAVRRISQKFTIKDPSTQHPHDTVENALFPVVAKEIMYRIIEEYEGRDLNYENTQIIERKRKYTRSYRRMMKPVLDTLVFRTNNPSCNSLMDGIALVRKYLDKKHACYPETEDVPKDLLSGVPEEIWAKKNGTAKRVVKHFFEVCVLQKLEKALKNKEVWVEGSLIVNF